MDATIWNLFLSPLLRHGLTAAGTYLAAKGLADTATAEAITGGAFAGASVVWSVVSKLIHAKPAA